MASNEKEKQVKEPMPPLRLWFLPVAVGWIIPGGGHFLLKRSGRGALLLASVTCMFLLGLMMQGMLFTPQTTNVDLLTMAISVGGYIGNMAAGLLYFLTTWMGYNVPDLPGAVHDYGTKFLVTAGLLNILAMVDAFEIAAGRKD